MARSGIGVALAAAVVFSLSGCGTLWNCGGTDGAPGGEKRIFGGVLLDSASVIEAASGSKPRWADEHLFSSNDAGLAVLDLPLSAVADILTLPITTWAAMNKKETPAQEVDWRHGYNLGDVDSHLTYDKIHGGIE